MRNAMTWKPLGIALLLPLLVACGAESAGQAHAVEGEETPTVVDKIERSEAEWREVLTPEQYHIAREAGTERAFSGEYWNHKAEGTYVCAACGLPLFSSEAKFDSGTGWPSYWEPIDPSHVLRRTDRSLGMARTEVLCARCDAHLGHVFEDGPEPTGLRYCINSAVLDFRPAE